MPRTREPQLHVPQARETAAGEVIMTWRGTYTGPPPGGSVDGGESVHSQDFSDASSAVHQRTGRALVRASSSPIEEYIAKYQVVKSSWRGKYERIFALAPARFSTIDPKDFEVTNTWSFTALSSITLDPSDAEVRQLQVVVSCIVMGWLTALHSRASRSRCREARKTRSSSCAASSGRVCCRICIGCRAIT